MNENRDATHQQSSTTAGRGGEDDDDDEEDYWEEDGFEGTPLEEYSTSLDYDNGEDEYEFFTCALLSEYEPALTGVSIKRQDAETHENSCRPLRLFS